jgi:hypothetical protein
MTISTKIEVATSAKANGFRYVRSEDIAVISVLAERDAPGTPLKTVLQKCVVRFEAFFVRWLGVLSHDRVFLFAATAPWDQHNAVSRRRGIWGTEHLGWLPTDAPRSPSVEIISEGGARFAGIVEIRNEDLFEAADFVRTNGGSFLFVSPRAGVEEERVRAMANKVFPKGEAVVEWGNAIELLGEGEDICIRVGGGFDDRQVSIDVFLSAELLRRVGEP